MANTYQIPVLVIKQIRHLSPWQREENFISFHSKMRSSLLIRGRCIKVWCSVIFKIWEGPLFQNPSSSSDLGPKTFIVSKFSKKLSMGNRKASNLLQIQSKLMLLILHIWIITYKLIITMVLGLMTGSDFEKVSPTMHWRWGAAPYYNPAALHYMAVRMDDFESSYPNFGLTHLSHVLPKTHVIL